MLYIVYGWTHFCLKTRNIFHIFLFNSFNSVLPLKMLMSSNWMSLSVGGHRVETHYVQHQEVLQ